MAKHEIFRFMNLEEIRKKVQELDVKIAFKEDLSPLHIERKVGGLTAANSLAILPMEGCDSNPDGSPSELTERRYHRLAKGGAGLVWWEACAVVEEGRANPFQMMLTPDNVGQFAALLKKLNQEARDINGYRPLHVLQLTHSGRYSRPEGNLPKPLIPQHDPILDPRVGLDENSPVVSDAYLESLVERYVQSAQLAREAGFDGVDIKASHRYLISELLACHTREGKYGGSFENRSRLLREIIAGIRRELGSDYLVACRFNVFDAHPYPYGFGEDQEDFMKFDPDEPLRLVRMLCDSGVGLLSNSAGNPYYIYPQVTRPFDRSSLGIPVPDEHPLESIARLFEFTRKIQKTAGNIPVVGNGYTWLRQFLPHAGAANLADGSCSFVGLGRQAFAYPDAPEDILAGRGLDPGKCCIACSKCTQIMRDHGRTGCVVRDAKVYAPLYREARQDAERRAAANHVKVWQ